MEFQLKKHTSRSKSLVFELVQGVSLNYQTIKVRTFCYVDIRFEVVRDVDAQPHRETPFGSPLPARYSNTIHRRSATTKKFILPL